MREPVYYIYILASRTHVLYIGVTNNLERRVYEHRSEQGNGFASRYGCNRLVWFECHADPLRAITREKELKGWRRARKIALIEQGNRTWVDLNAERGTLIPQPSGTTNDGGSTADPSLRSG